MSNSMGKFKSFVAFCIIIVISVNMAIAQNAINQFDTNGKNHGVWRKYYTNKRIRYQGQFEHGKEIGTFKFYSAASSDHPIVVNLLSKGKMNGKARVGKWLFFHEDGKTVMSEENYSNGKLHGEYKTFYRSGKPTEISYYKDGFLDSIYRKYSIKGHLYQHFNYKGGKLNGEAVYYSRKTGSLTTKGLFNNDVRVGTWENYIDGELISTEQPALKKDRDKDQ